MNALAHATVVNDPPKPCCTPSRGANAASTAIACVRSVGGSRNAVTVPGGVALVGTDTPFFSQDGEGPMRRKKVKSFDCEIGTVTNEEFARFVADTGYETEAERLNWSFVFYSDVAPSLGQTQGIQGLEWWRRVDGANWRLPNGPGTGPALQDHPVVQVSWNDAVAYATWAGGRLPSETEWEHAARGGLGDVKYPWGDQDPNDTDHFPCNIWQGDFPSRNSCQDGYSTTAPSISFEPNGYGIYNLVGNVWEWTRDPFVMRSASLRKQKNAKAEGPKKVLKGGSFLCHASYCTRYRIAARTGNTPDSASTHTGFRVIYATS